MIMEYFGFSVIFSFVNNFFLYWIEYIKEKKVYNEPLPVQHWTNTKECFLGNIYDYEWGSHYLSFEQYGKLNYPCITCKGFSYCYKYLYIFKKTTTGKPCFNEYKEGEKNKENVDMHVHL